MRLSILLSILTAFVFWLYSPSLSQDFYMVDDGIYVTSNILVKNGITLEALKWTVSTFFYGNWCPVTWFSHMLDVEMYGMVPSLHHLTSLIFHVLNFLLLFFFLRILTNNLNLAIFVSVLFAVHPLGVETVTWISSRKELLTTFFSLATLISFLLYKKSSKEFLYYFSIFCYFLALASKVTAISLFPLILFLEYFCSKRISLKILPFFLLAIVLFLVNFVAQKYALSIYYDSSRDFTKTLALVIEHYYQYLRIILLPGFGYSNLYPQETVEHVFNWYAVILTPIFCLALFAYSYIRKNWLVFFGLLWFSMAVFLYLQFVPVGIQAIAHRWIYQAQIGIYLVIFSFLTKIKVKDITNICLIIIVIFLSYTTRIEIKYYEDFVANAERVKKEFPANAKSYNFYVSSLIATWQEYKIIDVVHQVLGLKIDPSDLLLLYLDNENVKLPDSITEELKKFIFFEKTLPEVAVSRAIILRKFSDRTGVDVKDFPILYTDSAIEQDPKYYTAIRLKAMIHLSKKDYKNAEIWFRKAYQLNPYDKDLLNAIGLYYFELGNKNEALKYFKDSLDINPFSEARYYLSEIYNSFGDYQRACETIEPSIRNVRNRVLEYLVFAECQYHLGSKDLALRLLEFAGILDPNALDPQIRAFNLSIELGLCTRAAPKLQSLKKHDYPKIAELEEKLSNCKERSLQ